MAGFDPGWLLFLKFLAVLAALSGLGTIVQDLVSLRSPLETRISTPLLWLPLGWVTFLGLGYSLLRLSVWLRLPQPYWQSLHLLIGGVTGLVVLGLYRGRSRLTKWCPEVSWLFLLLPPLLAWLVWLPLLYDSDIVAFAGNGTDPAGYIRVARSVIEGWYFEPPPTLTPEFVLHHPERGWVYEMMRTQERPAIYYLVALLSTLTHTDPFQGYLLTGALAIALFTQYLLWLVVDLPGSRWCQGLLVGVALAVVPLSGLAGNFYNGFLAHVWAIVTFLAIAPLLGLLTRDRSAWGLAIATFILTLLSTALYDIRYGLITVAVFWLACLVADLTQRQSWPQLSARMGLALLAAAVAIGYEGNLPDNLSKLTSNLNIYPDQVFSLTNGLNKALWGTWPQGQGGLLLGSLGSIALLLLIWRWRVGSSWTAMSARGFPHLFNGLVLLISGLLVLGSVRSNPWGAEKHLLLLLGAVAVEGVLLAGSLSQSRVQFQRVILLGFAGLIFALSGSALQTHARFGQQVAQQNIYGTVRRQGMLAVVETLRQRPAATLWYDGYVLNFLMFSALMHDSNWAMLGPYDDTWSGGTSGYFFEPFYPEAKRPPDPKLATYQSLLALPQIRSAPQITVVLDLQVPILRQQGFQLYSDASLGAFPTQEVLDTDFLGKQAVQCFDLQLQFPQRTAGVEPLLSTGVPAASDTLYVRYLPNQQISLGLLYLGWKGWESLPVAIASGQRYNLAVRLDRPQRRLDVKLNDQLIWQHGTAFHPTYRSLTLGRTPSDVILEGIRFLGPEMQFSGQLSPKKLSQTECPA